MFRIEIQDNAKAAFLVGLLLDGAERWQLRLSALIKDGKQHHNLATVASDTATRAIDLYNEVHQEFITQMEAEAGDDTNNLAV